MSAAEKKTEKPIRSRLFFALWPDDPVLETLQNTRKTLDLNEGKPVAPENFHITLLFLGEVDNSLIDDLKAMAGQIDVEPCEMVLDRLEHWVRPAVLCLTASRTPEPLAALVEDLKRGVRKLGFKPEKRPFRPHVTLARKVRKRVIGREIGPIRWPVRGFALVKSERNAQGSRYTVLAHWPENQGEYAIIA